MYGSRLQRIEEKRNIRRAVLLGLGTISLLVILATAGIPLLTRMALFLSSSAATPSGVSDTIPPVAPQIVLPYNATNSAEQVIYGFAESGSSVYLTQDGESLGSVVATTDGRFEFPSITLSSGENLFSAIAMDQAGNKSLSSTDFSLTYSNKPPTLNIDSPTDRQTVSGKNIVELKGSTENVTRLTVNDRTIIINSAGKFATTYTLNEGDNVLVFIAVDRSGNQTRKELTVGYTP